jgi:hydroxyacylglutathione hydrolase
MERISKEMVKLRIDPLKVGWIFLTHTDNDHTAAIPLFKNAKIFLSRQELALINGSKSRFLFLKNQIARMDCNLLDDGQELVIGNDTIRGILTPGHTVGSMCYLVNDKYLFTGDVVGLKDGKAIWLNEFFSMDPETAQKSVEKLRGIPEVTFIFTAHYGYGDYRKIIHF